MASYVLQDNFTGSGSLGGTLPQIPDSFSSPTWSCYNTTTYAAVYFYRGSGGLTVLPPASGTHRIEMAAGSVYPASGVSVFEFSAYRGCKTGLDFGSFGDNPRIQLTAAASGTCTWEYNATSGTVTIGALSGLVVSRIEVTSTQTRFYVNGSLIYTHSSGVSYGTKLSTVFIDFPFSTLGLTAGASVMVAFGISAITESVSGSLGLVGAAVDPESYISDNGPLGLPSVLAWYSTFGIPTADSPLGAVRAFAFHDFTAQLLAFGASEYYVCDLIDGETTTRVPISSWQGTIQLNSSSYLQAVIPAAIDQADAIQALSVDAEFVIYRGARIPGGQSIEVEMARSIIEQVQLDRGPQRYTCTISGYSGAFVAPAVGYAETDRQLTGVRSISGGSSGTRVRCAIDWFLRPGQMAVADGSTFEASYINYYAQARESYMDVGERAA